MITPADEAAVAAAIREAAQTHTPVYPIGGGTMLNGCAPEGPGINLKTSRLNRVLDYPADDMTITVGSGVTMAELSKTLAAKRQWLPIDVAQPERATVGGMVAANASGPRRFAYGTLRDYVIGLRVVDGCGNAFCGGGRVVKNAAGYNMPRLLVGSQGTLGVITQVTLMVRPMPETSAWVACDVPDGAAAERLLAGLVQTRTQPVAVELLVRQAFQPDSGLPGVRTDTVRLESLTYNGSGRLLVAFEGGRTEVDWMVGRLCEEWRTAGMASPTAITGADADKLWRELTQARADVQLHVLPSDTVDAIAKITELAPGCSIQAHAGNGVLCVRLAGTAEEKREQQSRLESRDRWSGSEESSDPSSRLCVLRAIKGRFDPAGILNPGRLAFA
jgi:glycolate oxidase FAD binding subunit